MNLNADPTGAKRAQKVSLPPDARLVSDFGSAPERLITLSNNELYTLSREVQCDIQLAGAANRFSALAVRVPMLARFAEEQGVASVESFDDLGKVLIPHSALKSYPLSYLESGRYDKLTAWLNNFTTYDLSTTDVSGCETIDDWIAALDGQTPIRIMHSTGTSGKLSFLPRGDPECHLMAIAYKAQFDSFADELPILGAPVEEAPILYLQYRHGAYAAMRLLDYLESDVFGGDSSMILSLNPGRFSAEAVSLAGRLRNAESKGELGKMRLSSKLNETRAAVLREQEKSDEYLNSFLDEAARRFRGKTIAIMGAIPQLYRVAKAGIERGYENLFSADSFCPGGGGFKGVKLPDNWRETVAQFLGPMQPPRPGYGMTEITGAQRICPHGHYHMPAWQIPFVLDPQTGQQALRRGTQKGRFGVFDLNAQTYWGGFLTGDEVTLSYGDDAPCPCGRVGAYLHDGIRRYSEQEGGDDKITCAGAPEAYERSLDYITQMGA